MLVLRNGRIVTPTGIVEGGIVAEDGVITHVGSSAGLPSGGDTIDAGGKWVSPGVIDPHTHIGTGPSSATLDRLRAEWESESRAAVHKGVTDDPQLPGRLADPDGRAPHPDAREADRVGGRGLLRRLRLPRDHADAGAPRRAAGARRARGRRLQALLHGLQAGPRPDRREDLDRIHRRRGPVRQLRSARPPARRGSQRAGDDPCRGCRHLRGPRGAPPSRRPYGPRCVGRGSSRCGLPDSQRGRGRDLEGDRLPALHRPHHHGR